MSDGGTATRVAVVGAGYVGLTTAACLAHLGHDVTCGDVDEQRVAALADGVIPIHEEGLQELVRDGLDAGRLRFVVGAGPAADGAAFVFLCVPTPQGEDGSADMRIVQEVAAEIGPRLGQDAVVVNKSTAPVGSTRVVERALGRRLAVVSNPEFLREGSAVHDFLHPSRIVIGADDQAAAIRVVDLFDGVRAPVVVTDPPTAETIKYASNAFLATKVSFVNAIANVCEAVGANVREVTLGMGYDRRINSEFLRPGPGWGGSCFPKDSAALVRIAEDAGYDFRLLKGVIEVNAQQQERVVAKVVRAAGGSVRGKRVAAWGLTFKAGTDDLRESPALVVIGRLADAGATVAAYDPTRKEPLPGMEVVADPYDACEAADVLVVLTEWDEFRWLDLGIVRSRMAAAHIVDTRGLIEPAAARRAGFALSGIGLP
ncbi:MAG TPA: UDP-glucose/GDP-mannose dehydrogenase family protein [Acidimicrobiales bacterium]|nr:UDP-glucose/GDP-mannose dehydrogenase family protein [Acidimicrobiales bacterium]